MELDTPAMALGNASRQFQANACAASRTALEITLKNPIPIRFRYTRTGVLHTDTIRIGDTTGEVLTVDLLSTKLRTFDNLFVRIPNETVMKAEVVNLTRFPLRRFDLDYR